MVLQTFNSYAIHVHFLHFLTSNMLYLGAKWTTKSHLCDCGHFRLKADTSCTHVLFLFSHNLDYLDNDSKLSNEGNDFNTEGKYKEGDNNDGSPDAIDDSPKS